MISPSRRLIGFRDKCDASVVIEELCLRAALALGLTGRDSD
jgi:hypothetical protein